MINIKEILEQTNKIIKLKTILNPLERKVSKLEKEEEKIESILFNKQLPLISLDTIREKVKEVATNSVKTKTVKTIIRFNNSGYNNTIVISSGFFRFSTDGRCNGNEYKNIIACIEKVSDENITFKHPWNDNIRDIPIKSFTENKNIDAEYFMKFIKFFKEYKKIIPITRKKTKKINNKIILRVDDKWLDNKWMNCICIYFKNKFTSNDLPELTPEEYIKAEEFINDVYKKEEVIKDLIKRIDDFNMPKIIIKQITSNNK